MLSMRSPKVDKRRVLQLASLCAIFIFVLSSIYIYQNRYVRYEDMINYAKEYNETYRNLAENKIIHPENRTLLKFYKDDPRFVKISISIMNGAVLEFTTSKPIFSDFDITDKPIEKYFFNSNADQVAIALNNVRGSLSDDVFDNILPLSISGNSTVLVTNTSANGIYCNYAIMKSSNQQKDWTEQVAHNDALFYFEWDLISAFTESEDFRECLAYPELSAIASRIWERKKHGEYADLFQEEKDLQLLNKTAIIKYHVTPTFLRQVCEFVNEKNEVPPWYEKLDPSGWWRNILSGAIVTLFFMTIFKIWEKREFIHLKLYEYLSRKVNNKQKYQKHKR